LLKYLFDTTDGANAAGLSYMRIPLGASDFSPRGRSDPVINVILLDDIWRLEYSFDDVDEDREMSGFRMNNAPPYLFSVLQDIQSLTKS